MGNSRSDYMRKWRQKNKAQLQEYQREYEASHKEKRRIQYQEWLRAHPDKTKEYEGRRDKAKRKAWRREWESKNKSRLLPLRRVASRKRYALHRGEAIRALGGKCISCGISNPIVLEAHHINGGGNAERRKYGNGLQLVDYRYFRDILTHLQDFSLLCANCHLINHRTPTH